MATKEKVPPKKNRPSPTPRSRGAGMWIGLMVFVSVWMFILGIFVGRGTAPVQFDIQELQKELAALKAEFVEKERKWFENKNNPTDGKTELHFYEILKDNRKSAGLQPDPTAPKADSETETSFSDRENKAAPSAAETDRAPTAAKSDVAAEERESASGSNGKKAGTSQAVETAGTSRKDMSGDVERKAGNEINLTIQVASFKDVRVADSTVTGLIRKGYPAYRTIGDVQGKGTWFRVRIGNFKSREDAGPTMERLKKEGIKAILVQR